MRCSLVNRLSAIADALYYGTTAYTPHSVVDVATLTGSVLTSYEVVIEWP